MSKAKYKISNWKQYNQALINRGSITFWVDDAAIQTWHCKEHHGKRGRGFTFTDGAIETALMVKGIFKLPLRALQGFLDSIFGLMDVPLKSPSYSCISKRAKTVEVNYRLPSRGPIAHVVIDATGLKVFGEVEWKMRKHGKEKRRVWRKLHFAIDDSTHEVISAVVSLASVGDNEALPTLLNPLRRKIAQVSADGAYDTKACHQVLKKKGIKPTIPPRSNAGYWEDGHPRNAAVSALKSGNLANWKREEGYHQRSLSETGMSRYKTLLSPKLTLRNYNAQVGGALANVKVMNKVIRLGMPVSYRVD
ncbi:MULTISPECIES: IS5 family transposase [unclassified Salinivibrio]|uniref:IS5 family transposase n=1 Tax=unclassified Salinivibrio TaxID=2636825 RepID=UPI00128D72DB|nr:MULTISPECIES: IS5 family transposase [unclassified Salinivibrio]MPS31892.1 IS5 family transposase [Salinivibrio sp. VYel7]MPX93286.1 IS5 family transposase [Salinivibrio sp. VYel9]MPX95887.1 IS5 family transposase [Salinivibrio sp. VYel6]MPX99504.1 IS5 family transposase [Salinivibrio sp. VYel4]MPY02647.1 IS5 family transposase [Salinivibrio sp. VYel5]